MARIDKSLERITGTDDQHLGLDEIVACDVDFHMERMGDTHMWFVLYDHGKRTAQHVDLYVKHGQLWGHVRKVEQHE